MADSSDIHAALIAVLQNDAVLQALLPDGVYMDESARTDAKQFVIVTLNDSHDEAIFGRRGWEDKLYQVVAISRSGILTNMKAAAARIDVLLEDVPLVVAGYAWMKTAREREIDVRRRDDLDKAMVWFVRGGFYRVQMSLT